MVLTVQVSREECEHVEEVGVIDFDRNVTDFVEQRRGQRAILTAEVEGETH